MHRCDKCEQESWVIYIVSGVGFLCPECRNEERTKVGRMPPEKIKDHTKKIREIRIMARRKGWSFSDEKKLIDSYAEKTIQELMVMFAGRSQESINNKIKRLKAAGKIKGGKIDKAVQRAYKQRGKDVVFTVDQAN